MAAHNWNLLWEELQDLQGERISVVYDIGHGDSLVSSILEYVSPDSIKLTGHFPLGFVQIKRIEYKGKVLFSIQKEQ